MRATFGLLLGSVVSLTSCHVSQSLLQRTLPAVAPGLYHRLGQASRGNGVLVEQQASLGVQMTSSIEVDYLQTPISHFPDDERYAPHEAGTFKQRFWVDTQFYKPGAPVYILLGGEIDGETRLPYLRTGILPILAKPTGGASVILEHRYYGKTFPVANLTTDNLRFLSTEQSLADIAYFIENVKLPQVGSLAGSPVIVYGGSYAGGQAAFMRKLYPKLVYGAIASSAVTVAVYDYWQYLDTIRREAAEDCIDVVVKTAGLIDNVFALGNEQILQVTKNAFGLGNVTDNRDFANVISLPLGFWQARVWDEDVNNPGWASFCEALTTPVNKTDSFVESLAAIVPAKIAASWRNVANYAKYSREYIAPLCETEDQDECFASHDPKTLQKTGLKELWRPWTWQTCTEWAYWMAAPPQGTPSLISRTVTADWIQEACPLTFPPGQYTSLPEKPEVWRINQYGNFSISAKRLAFIDGSADPWRPATPHSDDAKDRKNTVDRPFLEIAGGVHHWDEYGREDGQEPKRIRRVHAQEIAFVKSWLKDWHAGVRDE